jgi:phosphonate transport system substrate-binding protein
MPVHFMPSASRWVALCGCLLFGFTCAAAQPTVGAFVIALKPDKDPDAMLAERQNLAKVLAAELGQPVKVIVPLSGAVIVEGLANGTIDVAYVSATDMLNARRSGAGSLLLAGEIDGKTWYRSYWVALKDKSYQSVQELRGLPIAFSSRTSTSGYVIPLYDLHKKGLISDRGSAEEFFGTGQVWFGSGYVSPSNGFFVGKQRPPL